MKVKSHWAISKQWIELTVDSGWKARHKITYVPSLLDCVQMWPSCLHKPSVIWLLSNLVYWCSNTKRSACVQSSY